MAQKEIIVMICEQYETTKIEIVAYRITQSVITENVWNLSFIISSDTINARFEIYDPKKRAYKEWIEFIHGNANMILNNYNGVTAIKWSDYYPNQLEFETSDRTTQVGTGHFFTVQSQLIIGPLTKAI